MEKPPAGKVLLDDTVPLTAAIEASQSLQSHTVRGPPGGRADGRLGAVPGRRRAAGGRQRAGQGRQGGHQGRGRRPRPRGLWRGVVSGSGFPGPRRPLKSVGVEGGNHSTPSPGGGGVEARSETASGGCPRKEVRVGRGVGFPGPSAAAE